MQRRANVLEAAHICKIAAGDEELRDLRAGQLFANSEIEIRVHNDLSKFNLQQIDEGVHKLMNFVEV